MRSARIGDIAEFVLDGTHASPTRTDSGIPVLSAQNVKNGILDYRTNRFTSRSEYEGFRRRVPIANGDLLLTIVGTIGRAAVVTDLQPFVLQRSVSVIRPKPNVVLSRFLLHATQTRDFKDQLDRSSNKSAQAGVYLGKLKEVRVPIPPLPEQHRIATALDIADAVRLQRRASLDLLDYLAISLFTETSMLSSAGQPLPREPLIDHVRIDFGFPFDSSKFSATRGRPLVRIRDVVRGYSTTGYVGEETVDSRYVVHDGDVLIGMDGEFNVARWHGGTALLNQRVCRITSMGNRLDPEFLYAFLPGELRRLEAETPFATVKHLSARQLKGVVLPLPPIDEQRAFATRINAVNAIRRSSAQAEVQSERLFASIHDRAFTGQL